MRRRVSALILVHPNRTEGGVRMQIAAHAPAYRICAPCDQARPWIRVFEPDAMIGVSSARLLLLPRHSPAEETRAKMLPFWELHRHFYRMTHQQTNKRPQNTLLTSGGRCRREVR